MFKETVRGVSTFPQRLSSDHDPLYRFPNGKPIYASSVFREIKTVPYVPWSHPFIERLIGTIRRECLDRSLFWTATDLEMKLVAFQDYYNRHRTHSALEG
jgi:putative transposase